MCGIVGVYGPRAGRMEPAIRSAMGRLEHRGPDDEGLLRAGRITFGIRRLAIIDVDGGQQPIANERRDVHVVANGEIYNYVELTRALTSRGHVFRTRSDVEPIVHAYEDDGFDAIRRLRGMFAIALYDERKDVLLLARDHFGQKPLYYAELEDGGVAFGSELKALVPLVRAAGQDLTVDPQAVCDYLSLGVVPQPRTIYRGVRSVAAGEILSVDRGGIRSTRYWLPPRSDARPMRRAEAVSMVREAVSEAVRLTLRSDVPIAAFLSGGIDSSIVVLEAVRAGAEDLLTFTVSMGDGDLDEATTAARTARHLGVENVLVPARIDPVADLLAVVDAYDQPFADSSAVAAYAVSRATASRRKVVLTGDGGDELFGGYRRYLGAYVASWCPRWSHPALGALAQLSDRGRGASVRRRSALGFGARWARGLGLERGERALVWTQDMFRDVDKRRFGSSACVPTEAWIDQLSGPPGSPLDELFAFDRSVTLPSDLLVKMDIATSAWSLEARSPLLDHVLAERVATLPVGAMFRGGRTKAILRDAYRNDLSEEVLKGAKRGFEIPLAQWLGSAWAPLVESTLLSDQAMSTEYVPPDVVRRVFDGRGFGDRNVAYLRYALLVLELWLRGQVERS